MNANKPTQVVYTVFRLVVALLFFAHGAQKLLGWFPNPERGPMTHPLPHLILTGGIIELTAGALLFLGLAARPAAFLASGEMAVAYFKSHAPRAFWPIQNGGELAAVYCFTFLLITVVGAGPFSLDALIGRLRRGNRPR